MILNVVGKFSGVTIDFDEKYIVELIDHYIKTAPTEKRSCMEFIQLLRLFDNIKNLALYELEAMEKKKESKVLNSYKEDYLDGSKDLGQMDYGDARFIQE